MKDLAEYWEMGFPHIEGWVDARLLECLQLIDATQREARITGQIGEIGVYHGKLLLALAHLAEPGGKVTAIDVFDDQSKNIDGAGAGSRERLEENIRRFGPADIDYAFVKADSIALTASDKIRIMGERGPFRLFSVDGCHTAEHTCTDILTGQDFLGPGGILILDDYMQPHWPGVTEAVHLLYSRYVPRVKPFLYCCHKLFFVGYGWHEAFALACASQFGGRSDARTVNMFGSRVASIYP
jgi:SAM-dependent methyltransferase